MRVRLTPVGDAAPAATPAAGLRLMSVETPAEPPAIAPPARTSREEEGRP